MAAAPVTEGAAPPEGDATSEPPPRASHRLARLLRGRSPVLRCTLAGVAAWAITVLPLGVAARAGSATRVLTVLALLPVVAGPQLLRRDHRSARHVGLTACLGASLLAWSLAARDGVLAGLDGFRGLLGALAWAVYAVSWSHPWSVPDVRLDAVPPGGTVGLKPRRQPPRAAVGIAVVAALGALGCLALAWRVVDGSRAILAQALGTAAAVALLSAGAAVAVVAARERESKGLRWPIDRRVVNSILLLLLLCSVVVAIRLSRR